MAWDDKHCEIEGIDADDIGVGVIGVEIGLGDGGDEG
jgi:hypothetical protein